MAEIEEVPIADAPDVPEVAAAPEIAEVEAAAPKRRGRPPGSKNRPKAAPKAAPAAEGERAPQKKPRKAAAPAPPTSESEEDPPPPRKRRAAPRAAEEQSQDSISPESPDARAIAAEVLHLLSNRHVERAAQKREKYRSWFQ
jgi:hypothetical protein